MTRLDWSRAKPPRQRVLWTEHAVVDDLGRRARTAERRWDPEGHLSTYKPKAIPARSPGRPEAQPANCEATLVTSDIGAARAMLAGVSQATVHTDGGCAPNPGAGGCAAVIRTDGPAVDLYGGESHTTNNRMELMGAITALEALPISCRAEIISDSQYLINGASKWMAGWKQKNWFRAGQPIPNDDLWRKLYAITRGRSVSWRWVRGHSGDVLNEAADALATRGRTEEAR